MKKLLFSLLTAVAFTACQNTEQPANQNASDAMTQPVDNSAPATSGQIEPAQIQQATSDARASLDAVKKISDQIDALPDKVKKEKAAEIAEMRNMVEAVTEKQTMMMQELEATPKQPSAAINEPTGVPTQPGGPDPALVKDYIESIGRYKKEVENMQEQLKAISGKQ